VTARLVAAFALLVACRPREAPPPPPPPVAVAAADAAPADAAVPLADASGPAPVYRTAASTYGVNPAVAGTSKSYMVVTESTDASQAAWR
jgi:hypothetical protein